MKRASSRFLSLLLALVMTLALAAPAFAVRSFTDIDSSHWAWSDIQICAEQGTVTGFQDGSFRPGDPVTSAQFMSMVCRTFYADKVAAVSTPAGQPWYYPYTVVAHDLMLDERFGTVSDTPLDRYGLAILLQYVKFHERNRITRPRTYTAEEALDMMNDWDAIMEYDQNSAKILQGMVVPYIHECIQYGLLTGMEDGCFHGEQIVTRAQACAAMVRLMDLLNWPHAAAPSAPARPQKPTVGPEVPTPTERSNGKLANGKDATVENVLAILDEIKEEFPTGTIWGDRGVPGNHYYTKELGNTYTGGVRDVGLLNAYFYAHTGVNKVDLTYACGGWAAMVSERIFGKTGAPCREVTDVTKVRPGDIVIYLNAKGNITHYAIVRWEPSFNEEYQLPEVYFCHGNSGPGKVSWPDEMVEEGWYGVGNPVGPGGCAVGGFKSGTNEISYSENLFYRFFTRYPED